MLITLSHCAAICQSVAEVQFTGVAPLGAVSHRFNFNFFELYVPNFLLLCIMSKDELVRICNFIFVFTYFCRNFDLPFALCKACESGNCALLLKLLRSGCSGTTDDLLMHVFSKSIHMEEKNIGKMINFLSDLGVSASHMQLFHMPMFILEKCLPSLSLGQYFQPFISILLKNVFDLLISFF